MKKKTINATIISTVLVITLAGGTLWGYKSYVKAADAKSGQSYMTTKASIGNISINVSASGTVSSSAQTDVLANNNGTIESLYFKEGDTVKKGDVIAKIKDTNAEQAVQSALNALNQQNVKMTSLKKDLDAKTIKSPVSGKILNVNAAAGDDASSVSKIYNSIIEIQADGIAKPVLISVGSGTISKIYVTKDMTVSKGASLYRLNDDDVRTNIDSQNLSIQQAQNDLTNKKAALDKTTIVSPIDGVIVTQSLKVGDSITNGKTIATVLDPNAMQVVVPVDELDVQKLSVGMKSQISLGAIPDKTFEGAVTKISDLGKVTNNVTTYDVTVSIQNPENVKVGMTANVNMQLQGKDNVVKVPATAVQGRGSNRYVILGSAVRKYELTDSNSKTNQNGTQYSNANTKNTSPLIKASILAADLVKDNNNIRQVQVGLSDGTYVEIASGLGDGEEIAIPIQNTTNTVTQQTNASQMMQGGFGGGQYSGQNSTARQQRQTQTQTQNKGNN